MSDSPLEEHPHVLVVEDEPSISDVVSTALRYSGYRVTQVGDGLSGLQLAKTGNFELIVLDVMLPGIDGIELCEQLRRDGGFCPVLFLSARSEETDRLRGFVAGGDDYLTKPFSVDELVLRVGAILRRVTGSPMSTDHLVVADLALNVASQEVSRAGAEVELTPTEFRLLHYLMVNVGVVVTKAQILVNVWDYDYDGSENVVELYIGYLRRKIDDGFEPLIHTKRGAGYILQDKSSSQTGRS